MKISGYPPSVRRRFLAKVRKEPNGCWAWIGARTGQTRTDHRGGYGSFFDGERMRPAHRVSYEIEVGPIPAGLQLDHLCRNRACVNPDHLDPVSPRMNTLRIIRRKKGPDLRS